MGFSDNAIGFYLECDSSGFAPTLRSAERDYARFVRALEKHNKAAFQTSSRGIKSIGELVEAFADLPRQAADATAKAQGKIARAIKPIGMKVDLQLSSRSLGTLKKAVGAAVADALAGVKVRLSASSPQKRMALFDTSLSVRAQYAQMPQPPDMVGRLQPRKMKEGGIVEGPNKAFDSVLTLLQPGEMVLPKDVAKELQELAGAALEGVGGEFIDPQELAKSFAEVENIARGLEKLKGVIDAGFGTKSDMEMMQQGMALLSKRTFALDDAFGDLSFTSRVRLAPSIEQVHNRMSDLIDKVDDAASPSERLFTKILGPARFLALNKALSQTSEMLQELKGNASSTFTTIGGDEIGTAVENLNTLNTRLGLSRGELRDLKREARGTLEQVGSTAISFDQLTASMVEASDAGITDRRMMMDLAAVASLAAEGFKIPAEAAVAFGFEVRNSIGLAQDQFAGLTATIGKLGQRTNGFSTNAEESFARVTGAAREMGSFLRQVGDKDAERLLTTMGRLDASLTTTLIDAEPIMQTFAQALEGVPEAAGKAALLTGLSVDDLRDRLVHGDISGLFEEIGERVRGLDPMSLREMGKMLDLSSEQLQKFGNDQKSLNVLLERSGDFVVDNAAAMGVLTDQATNAKTTFQQWRTAAGNFLTTAEPLSINVGELVDMTKEFNLATLLSIGYLGKWTMTAIAAGGKGAMSMVRGLGKLTGLLGPKGVAGSVGKLTTVAGGAGAGAAGGGVIASVFAGISTGLTTLAGGVVAIGTALLSPPGIAFTVSFVVALLALGGAARLAAPALETLGTVAMHVVDGVVDVGKAFLMLDPRRMLAAGPGLAAVGAGFIALGGGLAIFGGGAGAAAVGVTALMLATGLAGRLRGKGISGVVEMLLADLEPLAGMAPRLRAVNGSLAMVTDFLVEFAKVSGGLTVLGGVALFQNLVEGFLGLIGLGSPMDHLARRSGGVADVVGTMLGNFSRLSQYTPDMLRGVTRTLRMMVGFMGDYASLSEAIDALPGGGVFANIGNAVGGLFGADSPAEKLAQQSGPIVDAMERLLSRFAELQQLTQPRQFTPPSPAAIEQVVDARLTRDTDDELGAKLDAQTKLLQQLLAAMQAQVEQGRPRPEPSTRVVRGPSSGSSFARDVAGGDY